jgi:hypothetical protein
MLQEQIRELVNYREDMMEDQWNKLIEDINLAQNREKNDSQLSLQEKRVKCIENHIVNEEEEIKKVSEELLQNEKIEMLSKDKQVLI